MLIDGINLVEGSKITNMTVAAGTSFPANPNAGELFFRTDVSELYVHDGSDWNIVGSGGSGTPGGNDAEVQFNDSGTFGGDAQLTWNKTTNVLSINGNTVWHAGNDGTGSGLDADTLDGQQATAFASSTHNHDSTYQPLDGDLTSIAAISANGIATKTASNTWTTRSIAAGSSKVSVSDGDGVAGNPTVDVVEGNLSLSNLGGTLGVTKGGTGATSLTGYVKGNGTSAFTASSTVAGSDVSGDITGNAANVNGTVAIGHGGTGLTSEGSANQVLGVQGDGSGLEYKSISGTTNRVSVTNTTGAITLSAPQDLHTGAQPTFAQITLGSDPDQDLEAATKQYVDSVAAGLDPKQSVRAATTGIITLSGLQTVDDISLIAGNRVLVKNQTPATANGIYVVASGAWSRATDMDGTPANEVSGGNFVFVEQGTVNAGSGWVVTGNGTLTVGVDNINWTQFSGAGQVVAGNGLTKTGNQIDVVTANSTRVVVNADSIDLATVTDSGTGSFKKVTVDSYGRVTGTTNVVAGDITGLISGTYALSSHTQSWSTITNTPTTLADYGITSALTIQGGTINSTNDYGSINWVASGIDITTPEVSGNASYVALRGGDSTGGVGGSVILQPGAGVNASSQGSVSIYGPASGATSGIVRFFEAGTYGPSQYIDLRAPNSMSSNRTWILPTDDPSTAAGKFLTTDASGNLSFATGGASTFLGLTDTPSSFTGSGNYLLRVNPGATAVEFVNGATVFQPLDADLTAIAGISREAGALIIGGASAWEKLAPETPNANGYNLKLSGTTLSWAPISDPVPVPGALTDLSDFPSAYSTGDGGKFVRVKATEDGVEFTAAPYTKAEVDALVTGLDFKASVRAATTGSSITLSGTQTIDTVSLVAGDRVLVKDQSTGSQNGIYVVASGSWSRATDADASAEVTGGMYVFVNEGSTNADTGWVLTTNDPITLDTTALTFTQFNGLGQVTAGAGLTKTGNQLDVGTASTSRIVVNADNIDLATVTDSGTGSFKKITTDSYGRVTGTTNVVAGDITGLVDSTYVNVSGDTMTGVLTLSAGTYLAPALTFGDSSTGLYKYGTNEIGVTLNGTRHTRFAANAIIPLSETANFQVRPTVYSDSNSFGAFDGYSYGGTLSSPTAVASGRGLARFGGVGYDGTTVARAAEVTIATGGAWSGTSRPAYISFLTTPVNGTSSSERMRITPEGGVGLGTTSITGYRLAIGGTVTGSTTGVGNYVYASVGNDVTHAYGFRCGMPVPSGTAATQLHYFRAQQDTFTGTVASQYGYSVSSNLTGATNNYGFYGDLAAASNVWNLYMAGTASNYINGTLLLGTTTDNGTDKLQVSGTAAVTAPDSAANNTQVPTTAWVRTYASGAYQPLDADLTAIAALSGTSGFLKKTAADTWTLDTNTYQPLDAQLTDIAGLSPTKGNLIVGDGTNFISIGVGTNDYVLTADDTTASGVKWAAGGGGGTGDTSATPNTLAQRDASADLYAANFVSTSDERLKENVRPITGALDKVMSLDGKMFNFIGNDKTQLGLIAQEVEKVVPEVVNTNDDGYKSVNYPTLVALLIEAVKELARR